MFDLAWDFTNNHFIDSNWLRIAAIYRDAKGRGSISLLSSSWTRG